LARETKKKMIITAAIVASVVLYLAGVFSGLYANKVIEKETEHDINVLKQETEQDFEFLKSGTESQMNDLREYITFLDGNLQSMQLEQTFMETLDHEKRCNFSKIAMEYLFKELNYYWSLLPYRIEEYEKNTELTVDYLTLKQQYTQLAIRAWVLAKSSYETCNSTMVHGLHFYSTDCETCTSQGEQLDTFSLYLRESDIDVVLFTLDINSEEPIVKVILEFYGINQTPAILLNDKLYQGRIFSSFELIQGLE